MKNFFNKPQVKNILLAIPSLVIGALFSSLGSWEDITAFFWIKIGLALLFIFIYILLLIFYSSNEVNERKVKGILEDRINAYEEIIMGIDNICKQTSNDVNSAIHNIHENGILELKIWNFDKACMLTCSQLYNLLGELSGGNKDFAVAYVRLIEDKKPEIEICMNGFANQNMHKPSIYNKKRRIDNDDYRNYHDVDLFRTGKSDIDIIIGRDKINDVFSYSTKQSREKNRKKYNQYIAIPVICDDEKMIGLLEIVCLNDTMLAQTEKEALELASKYFVPYSYLMLLLHKLEKALIVKPK